MTDASGYERENAPVELGDIECRIVGAMIEKQFTTPDVYPMTTNALVSACNQKTNRDPVVSYDARIVDTTLLELRQRKIVRRVHTPGSRSTKHRQTLDEVLSLDAGQLALVSVLLLRGPQTIGELRQRTERQHGFADLDETYACLRGLAERALVRELARQPGQKESRWQHLLGAGDQLDHATTPVSHTTLPPSPDSQVAPRPAPPDPAHSRTSDSMTAPSALASASPGPDAVRSSGHTRPSANADLVAKVADLEREVDTLRRQLRTLAEQLGETLD